MITIKITSSGIQALEFDAFSYHHSVSMPPLNEPVPAKKDVLQEMTVSCYLDRQSPALNQFCCEGKLLDQVVVDLWHSENDESELDPNAKKKSYRYVLTNCRVTSVNVGGNSEITPIETITFSFEQISWTFERNGVIANGAWGSN
jgi:type VI secretion system secreted protein Hcp